MVIDLGVCVSDPKSLNSFIQMAKMLGFSGLATGNIDGGPDQQFENGFSVLTRTDISGKGLRSLKKQVESVRKSSMIIAVKLTSIETANWAAEDQRVDLLTLDPSRESRFRSTTARLAAASGTALEVRFEPLLQLAGLNRSKVFKTYRESIRTAIESGMQVILSSGATHPLHMRSSMAMRYVGELLGMSPKYSKSAVMQAPLVIIERNRRRLSSEYVAEGLEIVQGRSE